jgi:hypothetical protein
MAYHCLFYCFANRIPDWKDLPAEILFPHANASLGILGWSPHSFCCGITDGQFSNLECGKPKPNQSAQV